MRLVIYSAMFGRTPRGRTGCPLSLGGDTDCQSGMAIEEVMKRCHGRKHCNVDAEMELFGNPCAPGTNKYLTVIYTCVPKRVLKDMGHRSSKGGGRKKHRSRDNSQGLAGQPSYIPKPSTFHYDSAVAAATAKPTTTTIARSFTPRAKVPPFRTKTSPSVNSRTTTTTTILPITVIVRHQHPPTPAHPLSRGTERSTGKTTLEAEGTVFCPNVTVTALAPSRTNSRAIGFLTDWITVLQYLHEHREKAILYLVLGACGGLIILLFVVIVRLLIERKRESRAKLSISDPVHPNTPRSHLEDVHTLERSDSTADVIEVVRFSPRGTLRSERTGPYSLHNDSASRSLNNYYYG